MGGETGQLTVLKVKCQICGEYIGVTSLEALAIPIMGHMFKSLDALHGVPDPWQPWEEWVDMRCPYGRIHRAMIVDNIVQTDKGMVRVNGDGAHFDHSVNLDIGRESIQDRVLMVPENEADLRVRMEIAEEAAKHGKAETRAGEPEGGEPVEGKEAEACKIDINERGRILEPKRSRKKGK